MGHLTEVGAHDSALSTTVCTSRAPWLTSDLARPTISSNDDADTLSLSQTAATMPPSRFLAMVGPPLMLLISDAIGGLTCPTFAEMPEQEMPARTAARFLQDGTRS